MSAGSDTARADLSCDPVRAAAVWAQSALAEGAACKLNLHVKQGNAVFGECVSVIGQSSECFIVSCPQLGVSCCG